MLIAATAIEPGSQMTTRFLSGFIFTGRMARCGVLRNMMIDALRLSTTRHFPGDRNCPSKAKPVNLVAFWPWLCREGLPWFAHVDRNTINM